MVNGYEPINYFSDKWNLNPRTVRMMCANGKIDGAVKFGRDWMIPVQAERPQDKRFSTGAYVNWRKTNDDKKL